MTRALALVAASLLAIGITSCANQPEPVGTDLPGFWQGLLHGLLAAFTLVGSLFLDVRIYAYPNSGVAYDWGFVMGLSLSWWFWLLLYAAGAAHQQKANASGSEKQ